MEPTAKPARLRPATTAERLIALDALRGFALAGVLLVNLLSDFRAPLSSHILGNDEPSGPGGSLVMSLVSVLLEFKAFTLYSLLFGVGAAIQAGRARRNSAWFFLRRFGALLIFGLLHLLFVWNGDILTLYAVCGLLLIPLLHLPPLPSAVLGLILIASPHIVPLPVPFPDNAVLRQLTSDALRTYPSGTWPELLAFRWRETQLLIAPLLALSFPRTLGLILLGVAAWRRGLLQDNQRLWRWVLTAGALLGLAGVSLHLGELSIISLALAYAAAVLLWNPRSAWFAAAGRMALTNYLFQSILFGFLFYSYGLGYFGKWGVLRTFIVGICFYCAQLVFSRWWLRHFYYGPFEWLWRSISYLQWQPFLRNQTRTPSPE